MITTSDDAFSEYWRAAYLPQTSAFSEKGIFYSLGTEGAASQAYVNPGTIGIIKVNSSVIESDNELGPLCILNHTFEPCYTRAVFAPYWEIDMGVFLVKLTAYSLASGSPEGLDFHPRTWSLEVSLNGSEWEVVDRRIEDASMTAAAPKQLFNLREKAPPARYIRLLMEDRNEASTFHFAVSGLELYGELNGKWLWNRFKSYMSLITFIHSLARRVCSLQLRAVCLLSRCIPRMCMRPGF